jgi:hypothetical protein
MEVTVADGLVTTVLLVVDMKDDKELDETVELDDEVEELELEVEYVEAGDVVEDEVDSVDEQIEQTLGNVE